MIMPQVRLDVKGFELGGADHAERGVPAARVVPGLDPLEDGRSELGLGCPALGVEQLALQGRPEANAVMQRMTAEDFEYRDDPELLGALGEVVVESTRSSTPSRSLSGVVRDLDMAGGRRLSAGQVQFAVRGSRCH